MAIKHNNEKSMIFYSYLFLPFSIVLLFDKVKLIKKTVHVSAGRMNVHIPRFRWRRWEKVGECFLIYNRKKAVAIFLIFFLSLNISDSYMTRIAWNAFYFLQESELALAYHFTEFFFLQIERTTWLYTNLHLSEKVQRLKYLEKGLI